MGVPPGGPWTQASGPRRVVPGEWAQVPTADVLKDLQRLKGKKARGREGQREENRHTTEVAQSITNLSPNSILP